MAGYAHFVTRHAKAILGVVALLTGVALHGIVDLRSGALRLRVDPSIDQLLPQGDEERAFYERARQTFGSDEFVLLALAADDVVTPERLASVQRITERVAALDGVDRVLSIANASDIRAQDGDIAVGPFFETVPHDPAQLAALRERLVTHPLYAGNLITTDGTATAVLAYFDHISDREFIARRLSAQMAAIAEAERGDAQIFVTGAPHVKVALSEMLLAEMRFILPAIVAVAALLCGLAFRTVRGVVLPVVAIGVALVWTLGLMGWTGSSLTLVSNIVPPLIITLGFAAAVHVISEYYEAARHAGPVGREAHDGVVAKVVEEMGLAVAVNGFTTMLGFASLAASRVLAIRDFGLWSVVGVFAATVVALTLMPAALVVLGPATRTPLLATGGRIDAFAEGLARFDVRRRRWIFGAAIALLGVAIAGALQIRVGSDMIADFAEDAPVRVDYEAINQRFGGANAFMIVIDADEDFAFTRPENLQALREFQGWLEAQPEISVSTSIADIVMLLNRAFHDDDPAAFAIPAEARTTRQLLFFGGDDVTRGFADKKLRTVHVAARSTVGDTEPAAEIRRRIDERMQQLPAGLHGRVTGDLVLLSRTVDEIARGQLESIGAALLTIYLTLSALLMSFRIGLIALLPNLLPIAIYYGVLGAFGVPLGLATSLIGSIALGIAVDDTVHYFTRFSLEARRLGDEREATVATLRSLIRPVTFTTAGLCVGFLVLTFSELRSQVQFGALAAFTLAVAWMLELTLSPALCSSLRHVTLWDLLGLDLGENAERQVPLVAGLSSRQARIFALMSDLESKPAGTRLCAEGDAGNDMFLVIEGELAASLARDGGRIELATMRRGETVGEIALFSGVRTADVDVVADARVLRFNEADLERLGRRYPRIAANVHRNLAQLLAERVLNTQRALR